MGGGEASENKKGDRLMQRRYADLAAGRRISMEKAGSDQTVKVKSRTLCLMPPRRISCSGVQITSSPSSAGDRLLLLVLLGVVLVLFGSTATGISLASATEFFGLLKKELQWSSPSTPLCRTSNTTSTAW